MSAGNIIVREYRDSDFDAVLAMESSRGGDPYSHAVYIRQTGFLFPATFLIAQKEDDKRPAGYVLGGISPFDPESGLVMKIFVYPEFRRAGVGRIMMKELLKRFSLHGVRSISLTVSPSNMAALSLYESLGFSESGYTRNYFGEGEDRIIMTAQPDEDVGANSG